MKASRAIFTIVLFCSLFISACVVYPINQNPFSVNLIDPTIRQLQILPAEFTTATCVTGTSTCYLGGTLSYDSNPAVGILFGYTHETLYRLPLPPGFQNIKGLSCFDNSVCYIAGARNGFETVPYPAVAYVSPMGSRVFNNSWPIDFGFIQSLACLNEESCIAGGLELGPKQSPIYCVGLPNELSCLANAVNQLIPLIASTNNGWQSYFAANESRIQYLYKTAACTSSYCLVFGTSENFAISDPNEVSLLLSTDNNQSFTTIATTSAIADVNSASCVGQQCMFLATDYSDNPVIGLVNLLSDDLTLYKLPVWVGSLNEINCPNILTCVAVGSTTQNIPLVFFTTDGGETWQTAVPNLSPSFVDITALSCTQLLSCLGSAVDTQGQYSDIFTFNLKSIPNVNSIKLSLLGSPVQQANLSNATLVVAGDSVATKVELGLMANSSLYNVSVLANFASGFGCGLIPKSNSSCQNIFDPFTFVASLVDSVSASVPKVIFVETGIWDLGDFEINGVMEHFGDLQFDQEWLDNFKTAIGILTNTGSKVVVLSLLYTQNFELTGALDPYEQAGMVNIANQLMQEGIAGNPNVSYLNLNSILYPLGSFKYVVNGRILRPDYRHFSLRGSLYLSSILLKNAQSILKYT